MDEERLTWTHFHGPDIVVWNDFLHAGTRVFYSTEHDVVHVAHPGQRVP